MSRVQLSINVSDLDAAVAFYTTLLGTPPAKLRPGYANFAVEDPPRQDKVRVRDPDQVPWEYYAVLEHVETP